MLKQLEQIKKNFLEEIKKDPIEEVYKRYLGRRGALVLILRSLKELPLEKRRRLGLKANQLKKELTELFEQAKKKKLRQKKEEWFDVSAPGQKIPLGHLHPLSLVQRQVNEIFQSMGFSVVIGPEIETEYYNFDALNIPPNHPARDLWDTFWLKGKKRLLRTHTSPMQIRYMEKNNPPLRIIAPGRCFRHEATDASHDIQFYQLEGLMIDSAISLAHFKGVISAFLNRFFGPGIKMRLRPAYFPFVEPGFEIDIQPAGQEWVELIGAGMVHPQVLKTVKYNPRHWQGFAFGLGLDRLAMLKYQINDIRLFYQNDLRFLRQF